MTDQPNPLCICGQKYTMTEDNHAVNCPAHAYYAAWQKMQPIPSPQGAAMSDWPEYEPVWKMIENRVSGASPQGDGVETLKEALTEIAGMYSKWDPDGSYAASALFQASERARQALASLPPAIEAGPIGQIIVEESGEWLLKGWATNLPKGEHWLYAARTALQHSPEKS